MTLNTDSLTRGMLLIALSALLAFDGFAQTGGGTPTVGAYPRQRIYTYGKSCSGAATIGYDANTVPDLGDNFTVTLTGGPANSPVLLLVGFSNKMWNGNPLPYPLTPLGARGCYLNTSANVSYPATTNALGNASVSLPIPSGASYNNVYLYSQWVVPSTSTSAGFTLTRGLAARIDSPVVLRDVIGPTSATTDNIWAFDNWEDMGFSGTYNSTPVPVTAGLVPLKLKTIRKVSIPGSTLCANYFTLNIWSSLSAAMGSPTTGDLFNASNIIPTTGPTAFGVNLYSGTGLTYEEVFSLLPAAGSFVLQPNTTYYVGLTANVGACSGWLSAEVNSPGPSETVISTYFASGGMLASSIPGATTGRFAVDVTATVQ